MSAETLSIPAELSEAISRFGANIAMRDSQTSLSYADLGGIVRACQPQLAGQRAVAVYGAPSALFGALATACVIDGRPFVHLDPAMPDTVLANILAELEVTLILTAEAPRPGQLPADCPVIDGAALLGAPPASHVTAAPVQPADPIYLVATSGTTGRPKCIPVTHDAAFLSYRWRDAYTPYRPGMRVGIYIFAIWEMFRPLRNGAELCFPGLDDLMSPLSLADFLTRHQIHEMLFTPSFLGKILEGVGPATGAALPLARVILNGEVVTDSLIEAARAKLPRARLWNLYSICETHDICMSELTGPAAPGEGVTVGRAMPHLAAVVLDETGCPCPPGQPGLLHFEGPRMLAPGYVKRPEETARRFREISLDGRPARLYDTGDRGFVSADGDITVLGRDAHMLKLRGHSIQTSELTETLSGLLAFTQAIPWVKDLDEQGKALIFYYTADAAQAGANRARWQLEPGQARIPGPLAAELRKLLPAYCVPGYLVQLEAMPLNQVSGKCNYRALPDIHPEPAPPEEDADTPPAIAHAARILRARAAEIDPARSFHDQGGDSLMCVDLILALEDSYARRVDFDWALNLPLSRLHQLLADDTASPERQAHTRPGILLTGVTGFLGRHVLAAALNSLPADHVVYCLIRPRNRDPHLRLEAIAGAMGCPMARIVPVTGTIDDPRFGLDAAEYAGLAAQVGTVIHCAATVNLVVEPAQMLEWSRSGIGTVLQFCRDAGADLRFSSSSAVWPDTGGPHREGPAALYEGCSGYGAAKIAAEAAIAASGVPALILRLPSLYDLDAPNDRDLYETILEACAATRRLPRGLAFPMTDVRAAAALLTHGTPDAGSRYCNLIADDLVAPAGELPGYDWVEPAAWLNHAPLPDLLRGLIDAHPSILHADASFENSAARTEWARAGLGPFAAISDPETLLARRLIYQSEPAFT